MTDPQERARAFRLFLLCAALWFAGMGQQQVLFPYLVTVRLGQPAELVGVAQMATMLPSLFLAFPAGALADRNDPRLQLILATSIATLPPVAFAAVIGADMLTYGVLIGFGLLMGSINAFTMTARDTMLGAVADPARMQNAVAAFTICTFGAQLIGMAIAGSAQWVGAAPLFLVQTLFCLASLIALLRIPRLPSRPAATMRHGAAMIEGLRFAFGTPTVRAVLVSMLGVGIFYVGSFMVLVPLVIRDVYAGGALDFAVANICFWGGSIVTNLILMRRMITRRGRAMLFALTSGATILALLSLTVPFWVFCIMGFGWGLGSGVSMGMGRTIVQETTPPELRGRTLALFQLGFIGGAPVGALGLGIVAGRIGAQDAMLVAAVGAFVMVASLALFTSLRNIRA